MTLADVALYASTSFCRDYLNDSLKIMEQAAEVSVNIQQFQNDEEMLQYLEELRSALVDAYAPITQGVVDSQSQQVFSQFMPKLFYFLQNYANIDRNPHTYK